jgi:hypothetical protein
MHTVLTSFDISVSTYKPFTRPALRLLAIVLSRAKEGVLSSIPLSSSETVCTPLDRVHSSLIVIDCLHRAPLLRQWCHQLIILLNKLHSSNISTSPTMALLIKETSLKEAIQRLLTDSRITDVELEGTDGVRLPGCKGLLAARSEVFERMLLGQFSESTEAVVKVGYPGDVLKQVVRYCYTDELDLSSVTSATNDQSDAGNSDGATSKKEFIHQLLLLADAANYFELSQLRQSVIQKANELLKQHPQASFSYLEEAKCVGCAEVLQEALTTIQTHLPKLVSSAAESIRELSPVTLMEVLQQTHSPCEERLLYQLLEVWSDVSADSSPDIASDRHKIASEQLASLIRLDLIPASVLERQVTPGGLMEERDINVAYREQAKLAEKSMDLLSCRSARRWKGSKSVVFQYEVNKETVDFLQSERLSRGIFKWTMVVESLTENMFLGVEGGKHDFWLGYNGVRWRDKFHNGQGTLIFRSKSIVTMTLDLTRDGTLSATIDGSDPELLFTKMMTADDINFVPAVCIKKAGSVRFVGIEKLA